MQSKFFTNAAAVAALAAVYFIAGKLGLMVGAAPGIVTGAWPPTGIAIAALLLLGYRVWPGIFLGAFLLSATTAGSVAIAIGIATGNTLEGLAGAYLVNRFANGRKAFGQSLNFLKFAILAGMLSTMIGATFSATSLCLGKLANWNSYGFIWLTWWLGDMAGALIIAPLLVVWIANPRVRLSRSKILEAVLLLLFLLLIGQIVFGVFFPSESKNYPLEFLCLPTLIWTAFRFRRRGTITIIFVLSVIAIGGTLSGFGPFAREKQSESLLLLQGFMSIVTVTIVSLATAISERQRAEEKVRRLNEDLEQRVIERTTQLEAANQGLKDEITAREQAATARHEAEEALLRQAHQLGVLNNLAREIGGLIEVRDISKAVTQKLCEAFGYFNVAIFTVESRTAWRGVCDKAGEVVLQHMAGAYSGLAPAGEYRQALGQGIIGRVAETGKTLVVNDARRYADFVELEGMRIRSEAAFPLKIGERVVGVLNVDSELYNDFVENDIALLTSVSEQAAMAIERARLFEVIQQELAERRQIEAALKEERALLARRIEERTAELSAANAELARAARMKDEFLASMSHELRTPLNAVLGLCEALQEQVYGLLNEKQLRALSSIEESGRHLLALINDILDISKIEAGKLTLEIVPVPVGAVCEASLRLIQQIAEKKQIKIASTFNNASTTIQADGRRLKQILVNLLSNAVKFTPEGGALGLEVVGDAKQSVMRFTVWDTGIGILPQEMERLFQPFVQLDGSLSRQYPGTGLGLALVHRLIEMHGGGIAVESVSGKGSRFTASLPWQGPVAVPAAIESAKPVCANVTAIHRALIIEDSPASADQLARYLSELEIETVIHPRAHGAIAKTLEVQPDVIILDILLPELSGLEVLANLKAEPRTQKIPVLIVSVMDDRAHGLALGAAEYLVKPISRQQLQEALSKILPQMGEVGLAQPRSHKFCTSNMRKSDFTFQEPGAESPLILLVEDNESSINTLSDYLLTKSYRIVVARNGSEAIACAKEKHPDVILMDIQMPGMDGLEATRHIRADGNLATTPIIALTALAMPGDRERCLEAGANDYMSKPISLKSLSAAIEKSRRACSAPAKTAGHGTGLGRTSKSEKRTT
jgi:signal transduction histidine kinase/CheY-like chemotaxis protein/integral membrane sensor domain MASE1